MRAITTAAVHALTTPVLTAPMLAVLMRTASRWTAPMLAVPMLLTSLMVVGCSASGEGETPTPGDSPTAEPGTPTPTPIPGSSASCPQENSTWTVGLLSCTADAATGYTFFAPLRSKNTYLVDRYGRLVHSWTSNYQPGQSAYLLENGNLLRTAMENNTTFKAGAASGRLQEFDWDGNLVWNWTYSSSTYLSHHDVRRLPNGNTLVLAWEVVTQADAIAMGRDPNLLDEGVLWGEHILEVKQTGATTGEVVWEWHFLDHVIQDYASDKANYGTVEDHPELLDLNYTSESDKEAGAADWVHLNSIDYNESLDQILVSSRYLGEIYIIDHSTTSEEAASHSGGASGRGGDLLFRWGNPAAYRAEGERFFYGQHSAHWVSSDVGTGDSILVYNNGIDRPEGAWSTVDELVPSTETGGSYALSSTGYYNPETLLWQYQAPNKTDLYSDRVSGAQRLSNGHTLIAEGTSATIFEVASSGEIVWKYVNPAGASIATQGSVPANQDNAIFRGYHYDVDYAGLVGRDLTPGNTLEAQ